MPFTKFALVAACAIVAALCIGAVIVAAWSINAKCSAGPVGSCAYMGCYPTRGPTTCVGSACMCQEGYCADQSNFLNKCRAEVGSCHVLPCNPLTHGGPLATECINGNCLCHSGYHNNGAGVCTSGWSPTMLASMNKTDLAYATELAEADMAKMSPAKVYAVFVASYAAAFVAPFGLFVGVWKMAKRMRGPGDALAGDSLYSKLNDPVMVM